MKHKVISIVASLAVVVTCARAVEPVQAGGLGFGRGIPGLFRPRIPFPGNGGIARGLGLIPHHSLVRALGIVAVSTVGVSVLSGLTKHQRFEVKQRTEKVISTDPNKEVTDTYTTDKGSKTIKITASPSQPASTFRDDPALKIADAGSSNGAPSNSKAAAADGPKGQGISDAAVGETNKPDHTSTATTNKTDDKGHKGKSTADADSGDKTEGRVKFADLPESATCRRVQTEFSSSESEKDKGPSTPATTTAILCRMQDGEWKPVLL